MSHITDVRINADGETSIVDLDALIRAVLILGGIFHKGVKKFRWWLRDMKDSLWPDFVIRDGRTGGIVKPGECHHMISFPGCDYEVGVVEMGDGTYRLVWDYVDGALFNKLGGKDAPKLAEAYAKCRAENKRIAQIAETYRAKGKKVTFESVPNSPIKKLVIKWPA